MKSGKLREDLYFRLNVLALAVPPLRDRRADILPLADHLLAGLRTIHARPYLQFSEAARRMLAVYAWPGNVRELRNVLERAVVFSAADGDGTAADGSSADGKNLLEPGDFPENLRSHLPRYSPRVCVPWKTWSAK